MKYLKKYSIGELLSIAAFIFSALFFFIRIYPIIFAVHDDMRTYTLVRNHELLQNAVDSAKNGRISHLWNHILLGIPFIPGKVWFYKLFAYGTCLFDVWAMWLLVSRHIDRSLAWLSAAAVMSFATISASHNLFISYALCHQLPIGLALLSLHLFLKGLDKPKKTRTAASCVLFLAACMIYEAFIPFVIVFAAAAAVKCRDGKSFPAYILAVLRKILPQLITALAYAAVYFTWQHFYPPSYAGTSLYLHEPFLSLEAVGTYSLSMSPLAQLYYLAERTEVTAGIFVRSITAPGIIKAVLIAAAAAAVIVQSSRKVRFKGLMPVLLLGIFVPNLLIGFSEKYVSSLKKGVISYLSSFYSYLFLMAVLCGLCMIVYRSLNSKGLRILGVSVISCVVVFLSLSSDYVVKYWGDYYIEADRRYKNFDRAVSSETIVSCDSGWQIYAPDNAGIHALESYTLDYIGIYDDTPAGGYTDKAGQLSEGKETMCMRSDEDYLLMAVGEVDEELHADEVTIVTVLPGTFDVIMHTGSGEEIMYEDAADSYILTAPEGDSFDMSVRIEVK